MARLARWSLRHKKLVVIFWIVLALVGMSTAKQASNALDQGYSIPGRESYQTNQTINEKYGTGGNAAPIVAVVKLPSGKTVDSSGVKSDLQTVTDKVEQVLPRSRVASYSSTGDRAFVSKDGRTTFVVAYSLPTPGAYGQSPQAVKDINAALRGVTVAGSTVQVTGYDALMATSSQDKNGGFGLVAEGLVGGLGALIVLAFVFGSFLALVPLITAFVSIMTSFLALWGLAELTPVSSIVEFLIALVGLGIAIDYSLLVVVRWREEHARGADGNEAVVRAMETAGRAVVFSGLTVAIGLLALLVLPLPFLRSVGYGGMLIPIISVAVTITLLPVMLSSIGRKLDWPHIQTDKRASRFWTGWATGVVRTRWVSALVALVVLGLLIGGATKLILGPANGDPNSLSHTSVAAQGLRNLEQAGIGVGAITPIEIVTPTTGATGLAQVLNDLPNIQGAIAPQSSSWQRGDISVVDVFTHDNSQQALDSVRNTAHAYGSNIRVGGMDAQNRDFIAGAYNRFPVMIILIAIITFVLLARAFRSILLPLKAVVLNVLSVLAAWGALTLIWQKGYGSHALWNVAATGSIPSWLPIIIFAFLFGISMDYEVFILSRMREEYDATGSTNTAVVRGIGRTGRLVTSAALILFLAFLSMSTAPSTLIKMMATGLGAGVILDATIIRALLVPATVSLFGRYNWKIPTGFARLLRVQMNR